MIKPLNRNLFKNAKFFCVATEKKFAAVDHCNAK